MADNKYQIQLGVDLDTSDLSTKISKLDNKYDVKLGVDLKVNDIRDRITQYNKNSNNAKLKLGIKLDTSDLKEQIKNLSIDGKNAKGVSLPLNTTSLETSLRELKEVIAEIKSSFNSLDGGDMKSLLSSVNQIVTALGKAEDESDSLVKSLSALSKKDFSINLGIDMNKKGLNTIGYGRAARKQVIPELESQIKYLENLFGGQQAAMSRLLSQGKNVNFDVFTGFDDFNSDSAIKKMEAMEKYINALKKLASIDNINLDGFNEIHKDASNLINDITGIENAVDKTGDVPEKIKNLFGSSVDGENLTRQLDSVVTNLGEIKTAIQGLSSGVSIDGLTQSFDRLSDTIEKLVQNCTTAKKTINDSFGNAGSSVGNTGNGIENLEQDLKQVTNAAEQTSNAIRETVNETKKLNNISIDISDGDIDELKSALRSMNIDDSNIEEATRELNELNIAAKNVSATFKSGQLVKVDIKGIETTVDGLERAITATTNFGEEAVASSIKYSQAFDKITNTAQKAKLELADTGANGFEYRIESIRKESEKFVGTSGELKEAISRVDIAFENLKTADEVGETKALANAYEELEKAIELANSQLTKSKQLNKDTNAAKALQQEKTILNNQMETWLRENTRAAEDFGDEIRRLQASLNSLDADGVKEVRKQFRAFQSDAKATGKTGLTVFDNLKKKLKEYSTYFSAAELFMYAEEALRSMFEQVKLIDSAMTELKKVTDETDESYQRFLTNAADRAKAIGTTIDGLVESTADFAKLGYGFKDAQGLAEVANIYALVGDEVEGVEGATESLISTMVAFKDEMNGLSDTDFAMSIVDKMNEVANRYSITSGGLGEALKRSASSLATGNNTLDESISLITAANEVVQDPEKVGNALKTISMRIRSAKTELSEMGEDTDGVVESTATLRAEIMALSGVDIMATATEFKSTYQILDELSQKWTNLSDIARATIIEKMAGKHQGNIFSSLMENFSTAQAALETSLDSAGSAMKEHERWQQSLEAQILKLKASWQGLSQAFLSSDFLKVALDGIIALVDGITKVIDTIGTIPTLLGAFAGGKVLVNLPNFLVRLNSLTKRTGGIVTLQNIVKALSHTFPNAAKGMGKLTSALAGGVGVTGKLKVAFQALWGVIATHPILAVIAAVGAGIAIFNHFHESASELEERIGELTSKYREQHEELQKIKGDYDTSNESSMISKYAKLSKGVGRYNENLSLTSEEYSEYQSIVSTIADQFPTLITGYDEQGNAILSCKDNVEALTTAYQELIHAQNSEILSNSSDIEKDFANKVKEANNDGLWGKTREWLTNNKSWVSFIPGLNQLSFIDDIADATSGNKMTTDTAKILRDLLQTDSEKVDVDKIIDSYDEQTLQEISEALENADYDTGFLGKNTKKVLKEVLEKDSATLKGIVDDFYGNLDELVTSYKSIAQAQLSDAFDVSNAISELNYGEIGEDLQDVAYQTVNNLDYDFATKLQESGKTIKSWTKELLNQLSSIGKEDNAQIEAAFDLQTQFNGGKISYGEYVSGLQDVQSTIDKLNLKNEAKEQLKISLDLDEGGIVDQYDALVKRLSDSKNYDFKISEDEAKRFLDGLTAEEYAVAVDVIAELDSNDVYETIGDLENIIKRELMLQGLTFDLNLEVETTGIEALNTALAESVTGSGLSSDSIKALRGRYAELEAQGYDLSSMFETTSHGVHLNREEFNKLEQELSNQKLTEVNGQLEEMQRAYDQLGEDIRNCADPVEKAKLFSDRQLLAQRISEAAELASQYQGLTSAYNDWLAAEESGQERDMYEKIIEGFENIDDEISRGWYDDATIEFLELLSGKDLTGAPISELKQTYKDLGQEIKNTGYTVRDFFTTNEDGDSTNTGVYNFLRAVETLETDKAFKNLEGIQNLVQRNDKNQIVGFDFKVVGGDEAIAEALGISEELVQIILRAADDAGFVVSLDGTYKQFAVLESEAKAAVKTLRELSEEETELGKKLKEAGGDFEFDFNTSNVKTLEDDLKQAQNILDTFKNEKGEINLEAKGATEAMQIVSTLQARLDNLKSEQYGIGLTVEDEEFEEELENLQEYGRIIATLNQLKINPTANTEEIAEYEVKLEEIAQDFNELPDEKKIELGLVGKDGKTPLDNIKDIREKIESGEVKIPTVLDIQANMDKTLTDLKNIALLGSGLLDPDQEERLRLQILADIDVKADKVDDSNVKETVENTLNGTTQESSSGKTHGGKVGTFTVTADAEVEAGEVKTEGFWSKVKSWWNNLWSDDKPESAEVETDVNVEAGEIDTSGIQEEISNSIEELELTVDEYKDLIQNIEDKDVTLTVKVEGLDDVRELNKNIDFATNIEGDIDNLSEFVEGAKALSELDDNISTFVTAEVKGNVVDEFEYKLNNLKVFSDSAKDLDEIGIVKSEVTADIKGNVTDEFEYKIDNLKVFTDSAKDIGKIGNVESNVKATINSGDNGDVIDEFEYKLDNLGEFAEYVKKLQGLGDVDISVRATINSGENGDVIDEFEYKLDNLSEFANHVKKLQGLQDIDISVNAVVNTGENGDVIDTFEYKLNNLSKFADYVKELQGLNNVNVSVNATVNTGNAGDAVDTFEYKLNNLETFAEGAKALQGVGNISSEVTAKVNTGESGDAVDTFEYKLNNLNTFAEGAKALQGVGNVSSTVTAEINSGSDGDVIDEFEYKLDNLESFAQYAKDLRGIGNVDVSVSAKVNTGESGDVIDTFEYKLNNLDEFADYAKKLQGLESIDISIKANVNTGESGDVIDTFEYKLDNLDKFADYAKDLQGLESVDITITANAKGNVVGEKSEGKINNLEVFAKGAKGLSNIESKEITITANAKGNVVGKKTESKINNLEVFAQGAKKVQSLESKDVTITANAKGNVVGKKTEGKINNLEVFAKGAKSLQGISSKDITINANAKGNVVGKKTEGKINNLKVFGNSAKALNGVSSKTVEITANANGNVVSGDGASSRLSSLTEFKSLISGMSSQTVTVSVTANVDAANINQAITLLTNVANSGVFKDYSATVQVGAKISTLDDTVVKNYKVPTKNGKVSYSVDPASSVYSWTAPPKSGVVNYSAEVESLTNAQKHKTGTITYKAKIEGGSPAAGTASPKGSSFADGSFGRSFARGNWGIKGNGVALGGELGQELVVRDGKFFTIGDTGAEFFRYRKNDIVFNATQTAALFKYGGIKGANPRGKMLASGTAFAEGFAFSGSSSKQMSESNETRQTSYSDGEKSSSSSSSDTENKFEDTIDWIETILDRAERAIDKYEKQANNIYKTWDKRNKALESEITEVDNAISLYEQAKNKYLSEANAVGLSADYAVKVRNGSLSVEDFEGESDEKLVEKIKNYQDLYEKYLDCIDKIEELKEQEASLYSQRFDYVSEEYENLLQGFDHTQSMLNEYINQAEEKGYIVSKNYYNALIDNEEDRIKTLQQEQAALIQSRDEAVANNEFDKYSEDWYRMCADIDAVTQAIEAGTTSLIEYNNAIRDIDFEVFELMQERISDITAEADFLIELMSHKDLFDDKGNLTEQGQATIGLHGQNYNTYMYQADEYGAKAAEIDKQIAEDPYDQELINKRREYLELQRESILNAENEKDAIVDLVQEGIDLELDSLGKLIDKYQDALQSQKDLYDYQRKVEEQTKEISSLQKQLSAYEGDNSEEAKAKIQELRVSLEEAEADLEETEYDKYISDTSALLDNLYAEYELMLNERIDNIDYLIAQQIEAVNANALAISETLSAEADAVGYTLSDAMNNIWNGEQAVLTMYGDDFSSKATNINTTLNGIKTSIDNMVVALNKEAEKKITANKTTTSAKKDPVKTTTNNNNKTSNNNKKEEPKRVITNDTLMGIAAAIWNYQKENYGGWGANPDRKKKLTDKLGAENAAKVQQYINSYGATGKLYDFWLSKGKNLNNYKYSAFKLGAKNIDETQLAWTQENGQEYIVRPSDGAILTPVAKGDSVLTSTATNNIWSMANSPAEFIKDNLNLGSANVPNNSTVQNSYTQHIDNVVFRMDNVKNYDEMLTQMQRDPNFERLVESMSIGKLAGKSSLAKGKAIR